MKSIIYLPLTLFILSCQGSNTNIPIDIRNDFSNRITYSNQVVWEIEKDGYEVEFMIKGVKGSVNYDLKGKWIETEHTVNFSTLPESIKQAIILKYDGFEIIGIESVATPDMKGFEIEIAKDQLIYEVVYNEDAKFIVQKEDQDDDDNDED